MRLYKYLLISKEIIEGYVKSEDITIKEYVNDKVNNKIYCLEYRCNNDKLWVMAYDYENFGHLDGDINNYAGIVVIDPETVNKIMLNFSEFNSKRKSKWGTNNDSKQYDKQLESINENIDEEIIGQFVDIISDEDEILNVEQIKYSALMIKALNKKEKLKIGGNLSIYYKKNGEKQARYNRLVDVVMNQDYGDFMHKGHIFDYRKDTLMELNTKNDKQNRINFERSVGIIRGQLVTSSLGDASSDIVDLPISMKKSDINNTSGVLVINTIHKLIELHQHLTSDVYWNTI